MCVSLLSLLFGVHEFEAEISPTQVCFQTFCHPGKTWGRKDIAPGVLDKKLVSRASNARAVYKIVHHARECKSWL